METTLILNCPINYFLINNIDILKYQLDIVSKYKDVTFEQILVFGSRHGNLNENKKNDKKYYQYIQMYEILRFHRLLLLNKILSIKS
jgi:hypothetical protein